MGRKSKREKNLTFIGFTVVIACLIISKYPSVLLLALLIGTVAVIFYMLSKKKQRQFKAYDLSYLDKMDPFDFEEYICKLYKQLGYPESRCTPKSGDYGADVIAENAHQKIAVQVKHYAPHRKIGSEVVQKILGAQAYYHATSSAIVTTSYFTGNAQQMAQKCHVKLIDRDELQRLLASLDV